MSDARFVFLDVDGTYADHGVVPEAHAEAVRAARRAGHRVLLCTGRPVSMLPDRLLAAGFDGVVASAGAYVRWADEVLVDRRMPADLASRLVALLDEHDVAYILEAPEALHGRPGLGRRLTDLLGPHFGRVPGAPHDGPLDILANLRTTDRPGACSFSKATCFGSPVPLRDLVDAVGPELSMVPASVPGMGDSAGEIHLTGVHKAAGIEVLVQRLGIDRNDVVAFGDGINDLEMLEYAGVGVAIAGADPQVLAVADRVARPPREHGLAVAFADLGLV